MSSLMIDYGEMRLEQSRHEAGWFRRKAAFESMVGDYLHVMKGMLVGRNAMYAEIEEIEAEIYEAIYKGTIPDAADAAERIAKLYADWLVMANELLDIIAQSSLRARFEEAFNADLAKLKSNVVIAAGVPLSDEHFFQAPQFSALEDQAFRAISAGETEPMEQFGD
ncbi:hypothetical protein EP7_000015 [Isosphaeraceae bacterium EP7]